jgi:hypothetical protein
MAVEYMDGFDLCNTAQLSRFYPLSVDAAITTGLNGSGGALALNYLGTTGPIPLIARDTYIFGFDLQIQAYTLPFFTAIGLTCSSQLGGVLTAVVNGVTYNSPSSVLLLNTAQAVQIKYIINATVGALIIKVDGVRVINLTGINTGTSNIDACLLVNGYTFANNIFDNFWIFNTLGTHSNDFPVGKMSIQTKMPTGDGSYTDFSPKSGTTHFSQVNEIPSDDDTSYNIATTAGNKDTYLMPALTGSIAQVHAVKVTVQIRKDDLDTKIVHVIAKSGGILTEGVDIDVPFTYEPYSLVFTDDPNTSAQWLEANVNALEPGVKIIT